MRCYTKNKGVKSQNNGQEPMAPFVLSIANPLTNTFVRHSSHVNKRKEKLQPLYLLESKSSSKMSSQVPGRNRLFFFRCCSLLPCIRCSQRQIAEEEEDPRQRGDERQDEAHLIAAPSYIVNNRKYSALLCVGPTRWSTKTFQKNDTKVRHIMTQNSVGVPLFSHTPSIIIIILK